MTEFAISGVHTYWWLPVVVAFVVSACTASGGLSGAIILLPFQVSMLGFVGPAVTPTNLLYNIVATPGGVLRYYMERRLVGSIAWATIIGTLPGVLIGVLIRVYWLPDPKHFKPFAGFVLMYIGARLLFDLFRKKKKSGDDVSRDHKVSSERFSLTLVTFDYDGERYRASTAGILFMSFLVGIVGGAYGFGGGAIIAPLLVTIFGFPVYTVAGAALLGTFATSILGVITYTAMPWLTGDPSVATAPDWALGFLFGIGGLCGTYLGARLQKHLPEVAIKIMLAGVLILIGVLYLEPLIY